MKPLVLLDFDGVLFNSAYEAYKVCERVASTHPGWRRNVSFAEFMEFRSHLTDAWQFSRLYGEGRLLQNFGALPTIEPDDADWLFATRFFEARAELMKDGDWAKLMSPYPFFHELAPLLRKYPRSFKVLSTRNVASIRRTLEFFDVDGIDIFGQEHIREHGSKIGVARSQNWIDGTTFVIYLDDMNAHLEPFENAVDLCIHADWGYDDSRANSYTQAQAYQLIHGFMRVAHE